MAMESDLVTADMIEATEFPHLIYKYEVRGVPRTVVNGARFIDGAMPEAQFVERVIEAVAAPEGPPSA
jgi:predicted DsbA family dithiol-disulfide isomerase